MKPRVITKCVANAYTGPDERVIEFSHHGKGGLVSFSAMPDGTLRVEVYRCDDGVVVSTISSDALAKENAKLKDELAHMLRKLAHGCWDANCQLCDQTHASGGRTP